MSENFLLHNQKSEFGFGGACSLSGGVCFPVTKRKPMTVRTTRTAISLSRPFKRRDLDALQPAGDTLLDTDEKLIEGLSSLACLRVATFLHLPSTSRPQGRAELLPISPAERDAALEKNRIGRA